MKLLSYLALSWVMVVFVGEATAQQPGKSEKLLWKILPAKEIILNGWLKEQAKEDVVYGLPGRLADINSDVTKQVFANQHSLIKQPGGPSWWPGEQEGYWYEGLINHAFFTNDPTSIAKSREWVSAVLKSQREDGYIGIYQSSASLRPVTDIEYGEMGGELHTQAHCFLALIAFYEHTGEKQVLDAVQKAVRLTMKNYKEGVFGRVGLQTNKRGGNSHAVTFADPLIQLYRITGDDRYLEFVGMMYNDYNNYPPRDHDLSRKMLFNVDTVFTGHGAHTAESFHMVQAAAALGDGADKDLPHKAMEKLNYHLTPGGALVSGEMIDGKPGNGNNLYEHCTQSELLKSFGFMMQYTGDVTIAARLERLFYNGIQGSRLHPLGAVQYLSRDDRMDILTDPVKSASNIRNEGSHFQVSSIIRPTCCSASTGRALPYFVAAACMKSMDESKFAVMNFAPLNINTVLSGVPVHINEVTQYPFSDQVMIEINPDRPVKFDLLLRLPLEGDIKLLANTGITVTRKDGFLVLSKIWNKGEKINLILEMPVVIEKTADNNREYYRRGGLVYCLPFEATVNTVSENPTIIDQKPSGLFEYDVQVKDKSKWGYRMDTAEKFMPINIQGNSNQPWKKSTVGITGNMLDKAGKHVKVTLVPEGSALSRRVTFLNQTATAADAAVLPDYGKIGIGY